MPLMSTCVARLGSRHSIILDPTRRQILYGALGLQCQAAGEMVVALDDGQGRVSALPLSKQGQPFHIVDQRLTMTSVIYQAHSLLNGASLEMEIVAPFWPQDEPTSSVPAYIVNFRLRHLVHTRWAFADKQATRKGVLRFAIRLPEAQYAKSDDGLRMSYPVVVSHRNETGEGGQNRVMSAQGRRTPFRSTATDLIAPLAGPWQVREDCLEMPFDVTDPQADVRFSLALVGYCDGTLFERFGEPMALKYTRRWDSPRDVARYVQANHKKLLDKSRKFDAIWLDSSFPAATQDLSAQAFQSFLMNTIWCTGQKTKEWFSVWEGVCLYNSTVDVEYNDGLFYFACWPQLLEMIFQEWSHHANDASAERRRRTEMKADHLAQNEAAQELDFPGKILEHDMGLGWTANGQSYHHAMPVEENSNFLLQLYAHGLWWGRPELYQTYNQLNKDLVEYLLWADSTGNGFPDRGTANTIDDATPAVQYGRDNVYLGIKRLAALHAAGRMLASTGEAALARRCAAEVRKAVRTLNAGWLGDHWGVCLDKSAKGMVDCWTGKPLPYKTLPGWDAYSLYTTNGLLYLMMLDDLPPGLKPDHLRQDLVSAMTHSMTPYGCSHSSADKDHLWVSMNIWRDCAGGYLGENLLANNDRYWAFQLSANGAGAEKPNCFCETSLSNGLVWYPRGAAIIGLTFSAPGLVLNRVAGTATLAPLAPGRWPLLPLADWKKGAVPVAVVTNKDGQLVTTVEGAGSTVRRPAK